jgi:DNA-binding SARP family transcriptional activator
MAADHPDDTVADRAMIVGYAGSAAWLSGDLDRARTHSERALELATASRDDAALAVAFTLAALVAASDGDRVSNDGHYIRALRHAERAGDVLQIARIRSNRGSRLMEEGEYDAALAELDDAVAHADIGGYGSMLALALSNRGEVLSKLGRLDDARTDLTASAELLQQLGSRLVAYPLVALARIFLARGDLEQARGSCERALAMSATSGDRQIDVAARVQLARALAAREPAAAWQHAVAAADAANEAGTGSLDAAAAWSTLGLLAIDRDDVDIAARAAATATELARSRRDRYALAGAIEVAALGESDLRRRREQLDEAHNIFDELGCPLDAARVELRLARLGVDASWINRVTAVAALAQRLGARPLLAEARELLAGDGPAAPLAVTTLGTFGVSRGGDAVPGNAWQSKKARDLFKMVVVLRGRSMTRDQAMERLWPGEDPAKVSSKLSVALATVRSVLDPDKAFPADHFLQTVDDAIRIETGHVEIDVERFLSSAEAALRDHRRAPGERSATMLAAVESSYTGDVLEDDPYVDWYVPAREEARAVYLNVTRELAAHHLGSGERDDAIRLLLRILEREPYDEPAHLDLVRALSGVGRHGDARRRYQQYADRMRELDLEPRAFPAQR